MAMRWLADAWDSISPSTIRHCFVHSGIVPDRFIEQLRSMDTGVVPLFVTALDDLHQSISNSGSLHFDAEAKEFVDIDDNEVCHFFELLCTECLLLAFIYLCLAH